MTEQPTTPTPDPTPDPTPEPADTKVSTGYAVYDNTELRFVGRVHDTKADANRAKAEVAKGHRKGKHDLTVVAV